MARWPSASGSGSAGEPGPPGPPGPALPPYEHSQSSPAATWTVTHNLGFRPLVGVLDSGGSQVFGEVIHDSANQLRILFSTAFSGKAYLAQ